MIELVEAQAAEICFLRSALYEVITNGEWTNGEQCGDFKLSKAVYDMAKEVYESASTRCHTMTGFTK